MSRTIRNSAIVLKGNKPRVDILLSMQHVDPFLRPKSGREEEPSMSNTYTFHAAPRYPRALNMLVSQWCRASRAYGSPQVIGRTPEATLRMRENEG